jgi:hypothetical protein
MGSYSELKLGIFYIGSIKDAIDPFIMTLYRETDKYVKVINKSAPELQDSYDMDGVDDEEIVLVQYISPASVICDRLELIGFTKDVAEAGFHKGLQLEVERFAGYVNKAYGNAFQETFQLLKALTLDEWKRSLQEIHAQKLNPRRYGDSTLSELKPLLKYMLTTEWYGFPGVDSRHFIRLLVDICDVNDELVYDLTDLHLGGWIDGADDLVNYAEEIIAEGFDTSRRVIVLTEGNSDRWILERSLKLLYPHLADYFRFLDFEGARIGGGAGSLANIVKAFAGAGIVNRIMALFDNDTAAESAISTLSTISLPDNIVVLQYPALVLANDYPTLGPTGLFSMNVNGLAGSIELYLGTDVLINTLGNLTPIQWRGYDTKLGKYQGEIMNKADILERFSAKLSICEEDSSKTSEYDWEGIKAVFRAMRQAFHQKDSKEILEMF